MAYNKTTWINGVTVADEDNMNNIENGIEAIDNKLNQSIVSELSNSQSKFTNIQINKVVRSGNVVTVDFRGYINEDIGSNTEFLRLPYAPICEGTGVNYIGGNYNYTSPKWFYWSRHDKVLKGQSSSSGSWLHMHFTYITDDI